MRMRVHHLTIFCVTPILSVTSTSELASQAVRELQAQDAPARIERVGSDPSISARSESAQVVLAPAALRRLSATADSSGRRMPVPVPQSDHGNALALIGVGTAAAVVGLLMGDASGGAVAIGGGVVALYGLYRYLR